MALYANAPRLVARGDFNSGIRILRTGLVLMPVVMRISTRHIARKPATVQAVAHSIFRHGLMSRPIPSYKDRILSVAIPMER